MDDFLVMDINKKIPQRKQNDIQKNNIKILDTLNAIYKTRGEELEHWFTNTRHAAEPFFCAKISI